MKRIMDYFRGCCRLCIRGCEPERCLERLLSAGIPFWRIQKTDEFTLYLTLYRENCALAQALCQRCQCDSECTPLPSFRRDFSGLRHRWALLLGLAAVMAGMLILPNYVFAFEVEGCERLEPAEILRALEQLDVRFGTPGQSIDNEVLRNEMLCKIPALRWIAVNCSGMRATVLVAERSEPEPLLDRRAELSNLVACADGVVTELSVLNGQAACRKGDAVLAGQVLISALVDLERCTMFTRAMGEVYADTRRQMVAFTPAARTLRTPQGIAGRCIYLCMGRKRIKIFGSSGIFMGDCVKIRSRSTLTLPGGYPVPLSVCVETYYRTAPQAAPLSQADAAALLEDYCARQLQRELVAGKVLACQSALCAEADGYRLTQTLHCHEMIARRAKLPILEMEQDGTNDQRGTDGAAH